MSSETFRPFYPTPAFVFLVGTHLLMGFLSILLLELRVGERAGLSATASFWLSLGLVQLLAVGLTFRFRRDLWATEATLAGFLHGSPLPMTPFRPTAALRQTLDFLRSLTTQGGERRQIGEAAVQEERQRLARELHGSLRERLAQIDREAAAAEEQWSSDPARAHASVERVEAATRESMVEMQELLQQLQPTPLATAGLVEAIRELCQTAAYRSGAEVTLALWEAVPDDRLPAGAAAEAFAIAQEALANVVRHAQARHVRVEVGKRREKLALSVRDDGRGFDPATTGPGLGWRSLQDRAQRLRGRLDITGAPGQGAQVAFEISLLAARPSQSLPKIVGVELDEGIFVLFCHALGAANLSSERVFGDQLWQMILAAVLALSLFLPSFRRTWQRNDFRRQAIFIFFFVSFQKWAPPNGLLTRTQEFWFALLAICVLAWLYSMVRFILCSRPRWQVPRGLWNRSEIGLGHLILWITPLRIALGWKAWPLTPVKAIWEALFLAMGLSFVIFAVARPEKQP